MRKLYTLALFAFVITLFSSNASAQTAVDSVKYEASKIKSTVPDQNQSGLTAFKIKEGQDGIGRIDMDSINLTYSVIDSAFLRISTGNVNVSGWFEFYEMDANWLFDSITWNNAVDLSLEEEPFGYINFEESAEEFTYWLDITELLKEKILANTDFAYRTKAIGDATAYLHATANTDTLKQPTMFIYNSEPDQTAIKGKNALDFSVYPNPASDNLIVSVNDYLNSSVIIISVLGTQVYTGVLNSNSEHIDISDLNSGIYFLSIKTNNTIVGTQKIIIN